MLCLIFLGSAEADVGWGRKLNGRLMARCVRNMCTKNYYNWITLLQVIGVFSVSQLVYFKSCGLIGWFDVRRFVRSCSSPWRAWYYKRTDTATGRRSCRTWWPWSDRLVMMDWLSSTRLSAHEVASHPSTLSASSYRFVFTSAKEVMFLPEFVCLFVCLSVCLCISKITQKVLEGFFWNFEGMSGMAKTTSDSILEVIRKKSWILDHFEIFVNIALNGA